MEALPVWGLTPGSQQGRELGTAACSAPRAVGIGINPAKGRGCSFRRVAVPSERLGAHEVQGWARCSPGSRPPTSCSTTELPRGLQHSLLSRAQLHPSGAGPSCCVSAQRFEALGSRGERCWARRV